MKLSSKFIQSLIRLILGIAFSILGFKLGESFLPLKLLGFPKDLGKTILALLCGAGAIFVLPWVVSGMVNLATRWVMQVVQTTVAKTLADFWAQRPKVRLGRGGKGEKESEEEEELVAGSVLLDTSVIIDGRILDVVRCGFLEGKFVVPQFVLEELQKIADSEDKIRRERGRKGLEVLEELKEVEGVTLKVTGLGGKTRDVDTTLVKTANKYECKIATVDFNLNKVASLSGVKILNINELANALKTVVLPGEKLDIKIIQPGKEGDQGVGYLPDGTMIVVENGADKMGQTASVEVSRILQTAAGRMVFARIKDF